MTGTDESPKGKSLPRAAHSWGIIRPAAEAKVGCINVRTLGQEGDEEREHRIGKITREVREVILNSTLHKYGVDVCGISETTWKGHGTRDIGDYTVFYSGEEEPKKAYGGVGIAIRNTPSQKCECYV